jgi:hypothetical protein
VAFPGDGKRREAATGARKAIRDIPQDTDFIQTFLRNSIQPYERIKHRHGEGTHFYNPS